MPKISVIIPVYNVEKYLKRCLESVTNQTLKDIEVICVNDGSTDGTLKILNTYASKDERIKLIDLSKNHGASFARNKGLDIATSEYISFVDSDDYLDLNFYEKLYKKAKKTNADIVKGKRIILKKDGSEEISKLNTLIKTKSKFSFSYEWTTAIYKSSLINKYNIRLHPEFIVAEDVAFLNEILLKTDKIETVNNVIYYYCRRDNSLNEEVYSEEKIFNNLSVIEYILSIYDNAFDKKCISADIYLQQYAKYLDNIPKIVMNRTKDFRLKKECIKKYIEMFNKCKLRDGIEVLITQKNKKLLPLIKNNNINKIINIFKVYEIKVSVIIPIYNVEPYIRRCLDSLVNQTLKDIEIILIDDCSTDNSLNIAREYAQKDSRIKLIELAANQGAAVARNKGLEIAQGEYLGFVDPDDDLDLNFYEELYKKASPKKLDIVKSQRIKIEEDGSKKKGILNESIRKMKSIYYFTYEWQTAIYKASIIYNNNIHFPPKIRKAQDVVFLNEVVLKTKTYAVIDNVNYYYYKREGSLDAKKIPIDKIKSALLASEYILKSVNNAYIEGILKDKEYIKLYYRRLLVIPKHTIHQNDSKTAKTLCIKKFIKLFKQCKLQTKLKNYFKYPETEDIKNLIYFLMNGGSMDNYILYKLRNKVRKDMVNA